MRYEQATDAGRWVDQHGDALYRYALLRLRSPDLAADLVQDTFVQALQARGSFAGRSSERTWLIGILRHRILDHFRKAGRGQIVSTGGPPSSDSEASVESFFDRRGRWRAAPEAWAGEASRALERREFWEVFGRCLSRLPAGVADAFLLREVDGLDGEQVQQMLGISPANLWTRLHRARILLRRCLEIGWFGRHAPARAKAAPKDFD